MHAFFMHTRHIGQRNGPFKITKVMSFAFIAAFGCTPNQPPIGSVESTLGTMGDSALPAASAPASQSNIDPQLKPANNGQPNINGASTAPLTSRDYATNTNPLTETETGVMMPVDPHALVPPEALAPTEALAPLLEQRDADQGVLDGTKTDGSTDVGTAETQGHDAAVDAPPGDAQSVDELCAASLNARLARYSDVKH